LVGGDLCIDKFIGLDLEVTKRYHLYFTTLAHNLDWCIKNGIRYYQPGATDYHPKVRLGAKLIPLAVYARGFNPLLETTARLLAKFIEPKRLDLSFREIEKIISRKGKEIYFR
jgi:predicted N-acyltransferase